jgi:hypothetical protein
MIFSAEDRYVGQLLGIMGLNAADTPAMLPEALRNTMRCRLVKAGGPVMIRCASVGREALTRARLLF